ncbi:short-chain dehydrogenase [Oenococcus oeni]|uniref:SDR family oxidoreductase n=1 Tax=Oenococcus oeni TaxID=1247 RepID=UPI000952A919|nr:SDR family oxidoreductase [Oenococcus oeni]OLQ38376.1 short-chain dehydrogenase [Oenococcus oeni]
MAKTIFITGTSSGLGKRTAIRFAKLGWNVAATMRRPEEENELTGYSNIKILKLDVTNIEQIRSAVDQAVKAFTTIDVVVNNAGMGTYGPLELAKEETIDWQFAVNVKGPINVIRAFLPHFRANRAGMFINISSFMGITTTVPLGSLYNMSKFALEGLTEGLYYELKPLNIDLRLVEMGGSAGNNFTKNIVWNTNPDIKDYDPIIAKVRALMENSSNAPHDDPENIVDVIVSLAIREKNDFRTFVGKATNSLMKQRKSMPIEKYLATQLEKF